MGGQLEPIGSKMLQKYFCPLMMIDEGNISTKKLSVCEKTFTFVFLKYSKWHFLPEYFCRGLLSYN